MQREIVDILLGGMFLNNRVAKANSEDLVIPYLYGMKWLKRMRFGKLGSEHGTTS